MATNGIYTEHARSRRARRRRQRAAARNTRRRWEQRRARLHVGVYNNLALDQAANDTAAEFRPREDRRDRQRPGDREAAAAEQSSDRHKRICVDTDYFATFNRAERDAGGYQVEPIEEITGTRCATAGKEYEVDALVLATGFDAMTGSVAKIDIGGRGGLTLNEKWAAGPRTYLGLMSSGFPNLFIITGPGSPSVLRRT